MRSRAQHVESVHSELSLFNKDCVCSLSQSCGCALTGWLVLFRYSDYDSSEEELMKWKERKVNEQEQQKEQELRKGKEDADKKH